LRAALNEKWKSGLFNHIPISGRVPELLINSENTTTRWKLFSDNSDVIDHIPWIPIGCRIPKKAKYIIEKVEEKSGNFYLG